MDKILRHHFIFTRKKKLVDAPKRLRPKVGIARALRRAYHSLRREDSAMPNPKGAQASARRAPSPPPFGVTVNFTLPFSGAAVFTSTLSGLNPAPPLASFSAPSISNTFLIFASRASSPTSIPSILTANSNAHVWNAAYSAAPLCLYNTVYEFIHPLNRIIYVRENHFWFS